MKKIEEEVPKYVKKKDSSKSKSSKKAKHKHRYVECLLIHDDKPRRATYCEICGKIDDIHFFEVEKAENGLRVTMSYDEVYEKYKNLEQIKIKDIWAKYLPLSKTKEEEDYV